MTEKINLFNNKRNKNNKYKQNRTYTKKEIVYDSKKLYNYAINRLSLRDYSRQELFTRMCRFQQEHEMINEVLDKLTTQGYLSDERRARSMISQFSSSESINKTKQRILQKGVEKDTLENVIYELQENSTDVEDEIDKCITLLEKKFKTFDKDNWQKMVRFLASKGFKFADISKSIKQFSEAEN